MASAGGDCGVGGTDWESLFAGCAGGVAGWMDVWGPVGGLALAGGPVGQAGGRRSRRRVEAAVVGLAGFDRLGHFVVDIQNDQFGTAVAVLSDVFDWCRRFNVHDITCHCDDVV